MTRLQLKNYYSRGFSLLEVAIVLFVLTLVLGGLLAPLATRSQMEEIKNGREQLVEIRESLYGFILQNGRLPCPDTDTDPGSDEFGFENRIGPVDDLQCQNESGTIPWRDLGVRGQDPWGNLFTYRVTMEFAAHPSSGGMVGTCLPNNEIAFTLCSSGNIEVRPAENVTTPIARDIPALVLSHGPNGLDTSSADELENMDNDNIFVDRDFSQATGSEFDDLLIWISPHQLSTKMVNAGLLP